ncbi:MAG: thiamine biosynthesis protein ThiS [Chloroflexi bacterium]|nr:thiamine biosynthesis protein ThiS [Chloroflexota bacterium]|tara:strand:- start:126 stop:329 length:204 start_codon:yes stop_codon:yes gene_type:complete
MEVIINGKATEIHQSMSIVDYLTSIGFDKKVSIAVAINGEIIPKEEYSETQLKTGDSMEVVRAIGGG